MRKHILLACLIASLCLQRSDTENSVLGHMLWWHGMYGTPVTIYLKNGTRGGYAGLGAVTLNFGDRERPGVFWSVVDFTVPVMNVEPQAVTLFVSGWDQEMMLRLQTALKQGSFEMVPLRSR